MAEVGNNMVGDQSTEPAQGKRPTLVDSVTESGSSGSERKTSLRRKKSMADLQKLLVDTTERSGFMLWYIRIGNQFKIEIENGNIGPVQILACMNIFSVYLTVSLEIQSDVLTPNFTVLVGVLKWINFAAFLCEFLIRIWAETTHPHALFMGSSHKYWRCADVVNLLLNLVPGRASIFRVMMFFRIIELLMKNSPKLRVLLYGILQGLGKSLFLSILIGFIVYMYAIPGVWAFGLYDQFYFRDVRVAMASLFAFGTLEDWSEAYYTNLMGCDVYTGASMYDNPKLTLMYGIQCLPNEFVNTSKWRLGTTLFFVSYIIIQIFMANLFIGALTVELSSAYEEVKQELAKIRTRKHIHQNMSIDLMQTLESKTYQGWWEYDTENMDYDFINLRLEAGMLIRGAWEQEKDGMLTTIQEMKVQKKKGLFSSIQGYTRWMSSNPKIQKAYTTLILVNAAVLGVHPSKNVSTTTRSCLMLCEYDMNISSVWYSCVWAVFALDLACKTTNNGVGHFVIVKRRMSAKPGSYYQWKLKGFNWSNLLDCAVVIAGFWYPMMLVFRLLQVGHLMNVHALRVPIYTLQHASDILLYAISGLGLISLAMGCLACELFRKNDPWHFGTPEDSMLTLIRMLTIDDWNDIYLMNKYGCDVYIIDMPEAECVSPVASPWQSTAFFPPFIVLTRSIPLYSIL
jgi:hypothetical protein